MEKKACYGANCQVSFLVEHKIMVHHLINRILQFLRFKKSQYCKHSGEG